MLNHSRLVVISDFLQIGTNIALVRYKRKKQESFMMKTSSLPSFIIEDYIITNCFYVINLSFVRLCRGA